MSYTRVGRADLIARLEAYDAAVERIRARLENCRRTERALERDRDRSCIGLADYQAALARVQTYDLILAEPEGRPL